MTFSSCNLLLYILTSNYIFIRKRMFLQCRFKELQFCVNLHAVKFAGNFIQLVLYQITFSTIVHLGKACALLYIATTLSMAIISRNWTRFVATSPDVLPGFKAPRSSKLSLMKRHLHLKTTKEITTSSQVSDAVQLCFFFFFFVSWLNVVSSMILFHLLRILHWISEASSNRAIYLHCDVSFWTIKKYSLLKFSIRNSDQQQRFAW